MCWSVQVIFQIAGTGRHVFILTAHCSRGCERHYNVESILFRVHLGINHNGDVQNKSRTSTFLQFKVIFPHHIANSNVSEKKNNFFANIHHSKPHRPLCSGMRHVSAYVQCYESGIQWCISLIRGQAVCLPAEDSVVADSALPPAQKFCDAFTSSDITKSQWFLTEF